MRWGGGDGFLNLVDTTNNRILYSESQYLGLDAQRPGHGREPGHPAEPTRGLHRGPPELDHVAGPRRTPTSGSATPWRRATGTARSSSAPTTPTRSTPASTSSSESTDRGDTWTSLGDLTTGTDRRTLEIMGQRPDSFTLSLDDGIPYWPTLTAIAESEFTPGELYVGTDDGQVRVSRDGGADLARRDRRHARPARDDLDQRDRTRRSTSTAASTSWPTTTATTTTATTCGAPTTTGARGRPSPGTCPRTGSRAPSGRIPATPTCSTWAPSSASSGPGTVAPTGSSSGAGFPPSPSTTWWSIPGTTTWSSPPTAAASGFSTR